MNTLIQIDNKSGKIKLNDLVVRPVMDDLIQQIGKIFGAKAAENGADFGEIMNCAENAIDTLDIEIHSPGGSVLEGYKLYHELLSLRNRGVYITATINSLAASMASVIAMGADKIRMVQGGRMMIHEVSKGTQGSADEHRKAADLLDSMSNEIADIYAEKTGQPPEKMREMMKVETWMGAKDALEMKFIDEIVDNRAIESKPKGMSLLSKLFPGNDEVSKLEASILELDNVRAELTATAQERDTLKSEVSGHVETISAHLATIGNLTEQITALEATAARVPELESAVTAAQSSASVVATEMLAAIGQPEPLAIEQSEPPVDHAAIFATLTGQSRTEYYAKHGAEIRKSITK
jgi:ATP-dependent protease ClpP protease subunit